MSDHEKFLKMKLKSTELSIQDGEEILSVIVCMNKHKDDHSWRMHCAVCGECTHCV